MMTSRPWTQDSVQDPFGGVTDWYQSQVMAALVILIFLDVSVESMGSSFPRVILIGSNSVGVLGLCTECSDDLESDTEMPERHVSPTPHDAMLTRWRSRVALEDVGHLCYVTSSIHATRTLVSSHADLLPPRKRLRDSISLEDGVEEDIDTDVLEDIEADATADEIAVDRDVEVGVDAGIDIEVDVRVDVEDECWD
ncbi:hypothetical protein Tco_0233735 [Tanacetum coccineum]